MYRVFSHDVTAAILVSQTMKWRPCWCPKPILWKLNSFLMQTLSFVPINLHRRWPHEWKHSILKYLSYTYSQSMFVANLRLGCYSLFSNPQNQLCLTSPNTTTTTPPPQPHKFCVRYCFQMLLWIYSPLKKDAWSQVASEAIERKKQVSA